MKRLTILASSLFLGLALFSSPARADWHVDFGINLGGGRVRVHTGHARVGYHRPVHVHCRVPVYREIWIPASYQTVVVGYDRCRRPIVRTVCVRDGYWTSALVGYRCEGCGAQL